MRSTTLRSLEEEEPIDPEASLGTVLTTSVALGVVHVLTGPDHLSALIALSANGGWRSFSLGIRWGCGHTSGLVVIAAAFFGLQGHIDLEAIGHYGETCVGFFMVALGAWAAYGSIVRYRNSVQDTHVAREATLESALDELEEGAMANELQPIMVSDSTEPLQPIKAASRDGVLCSRSCCGTECVCRAQNAVALCTGLVHGIAGPGQILGVLPAVIIMTGGEIPGYQRSTTGEGQAWMAVVYLGTFGFSSTLTMGVFAATYGEVTTWCGDTRLVNLTVGLFSASCSVLIGVVWLWFLLRGEEIDLSDVPVFG